MVTPFAFNALRRFVEHDQPGIGHHGARDGENLLFPARQGIGRLIQPLPQPRKCLCNTVDHLRFAFAIGRGDEAEPEILLHR